MAIGPVQNQQASQQSEFNVGKAQYDPTAAPATNAGGNTTAGGDTVTITPEAGAMQQEAQAAQTAQTYAAPEPAAPPANPATEQPSPQDMAESGRQNRIVQQANQQQAVNNARNTETVNVPQQQTIDLIA